MNRNYCTACGAPLREGTAFCENCGVSAGSGAPGRDPAGGSAGSPAGIPPAGGAPRTATGRHRATIAVVIILFLLVAAIGVLFILPGLAENKTSNPPPGTPALTQTPVPAVPSTPAMTPEPAAVPVLQPDPFPGALGLKEYFVFGSGKIASRATVYRVWMNETYEWHNDLDNRYYVQKPAAGSQYLFVFVHLENTGDTRVWFPPSDRIMVHYNHAVYIQDEDHFKPDLAYDLKETPIEVREVQYFQKLNGDEYVEDFGYSHGTELGYLYPGPSNAIDGYVIYEVPQSLTADKAFVEIPFNAVDRGIWKLG